MTPSGDQYSWNCPSCGRRVPTRFAECRCGFKMPEVSDFGVEQGPPTAARSGAAASLLIILGAAIGLGIAVYIVQSQKEQPAAPPQTNAVSTQPEHTQSAPTRENTFVPPVTGTIILTRPAATPASDASSATIEDVVSGALPAVASIETGTGRGSGFFIRPNLVVTNYHVVEGQNSVTLQAGGAKYTAREASTSEAVDLALLE